jgi:hypothetical protein
MASYTVARSRRVEPSVLRLKPSDDIDGLPLNMDPFDPSINFAGESDRLL